MKRRKKLSLGDTVIYAVVFAALIVYFFFYYIGEYNVKNPEVGELAMYVIDVGQADSSFFVFPDGTNMLIDAGEDTSASTVISVIDSLGVRKIDKVVCTHPHIDHIGGMEKIISEYDIGEVYLPDAVSTTKTFSGLIEEINRKNIPINFVYAGDVLSDGAYKITVLSPEDKDYGEMNLFSAVIKVEYENTSFILMGDAEKVNENDMVERFGARLKCNVLKVGHHGSDTSTTDRFLSYTQPEIAVISVGENNDYGHPSEKVIDRLKRRKIDILRTDKDGTISFFSDGQTVKTVTNPSD